MSNECLKNGPCILNGGCCFETVSYLSKHIFVYLRALPGCGFQISALLILKLRCVPSAEREAGEPPASPFSFSKVFSASFSCHDA